MRVSTPVVLLFDEEPSPARGQRRFVAGAGRFVGPRLEEEDDDDWDDDEEEGEEKGEASWE